MLQDSMKESAAVTAFLNAQPLPTRQVDCVKLAWHAACLWQRQQDIEITKNYTKQLDLEPFDDLITQISEQRTLHLPTSVK